MALGKVSVNNLNLAQGEVAEIERYFLFIGPAGKNVGKLLPLNTDSDLDNDLGVADSDLKTQIIAARANGGDRWACLAAPIGAEGEWAKALNLPSRKASLSKRSSSPNPWPAARSYWPCTLQQNN